LEIGGSYLPFVTTQAPNGIIILIMSKDYEFYEDLSQQELKKLYNQVQELEEMVSGLIDILLENIDNDNLSKQLCQRWLDYKKEIQ